MTPYTGSGPNFGRNPIVIVNGKRYILKERACTECVHSVNFVDRSPLCCRINLCDLEFTPDMKLKLESRLRAGDRDPGDTPLSRFYFLEALRYAKVELEESHFRSLIEDKRILDCDDRKNCYSLTNQGGLYRVCDLAYLFRNEGRAESFVAATFKERDKNIASFLAPPLR